MIPRKKRENRIDLADGSYVHFTDEPSDPPRVITDNPSLAAKLEHDSETTELANTKRQRVFRLPGYRRKGLVRAALWKRKGKSRTP